MCQVDIAILALAKELPVQAEILTGGPWDSRLKEARSMLS
jgi:hypothetical protein